MAQFPPMFVDPNRPIDDIDPDLLDAQWPTRLNPLAGSMKSGSGLIHTLASDYEPLYTTRLSVRQVEQRISNYYTPYHDALSNLLTERHGTFGSAFQLSCHSMSSIGPKDGLQRPDICLGDLNGTTASRVYVDTVTEIFRGKGFDVAVNKPFPGNELLRRHAAPSNGTYSLQVEMRRGLYLDEETRELSDGLPLLQDCFRQIAGSIRELV